MNKTFSFVFLLFYVAIASAFPKYATWTGHENPDSDSVACAIAGAELFEGSARISGGVGNEVRFLLSHAKLPVPRQLENKNTEAVVLVDHNQKSHMPRTLNEKCIVGILDHHRFAEDTIQPDHMLTVDIRPWAACSAIMADRYFQSGKSMTRGTAVMLLGGILSDSKNAPGPRERELAEKLARIAGIPHIQEFGRQMLEAKSDYSLMNDREVILSDYKEYSVNGLKVGFGLAETLHPEPLLRRVRELAEAAETIRIERQLAYLFFAIKDLPGKQAMLLRGKTDAIAEKAYDKAITRRTDDFFVLCKTSRKNFLIPRLIQSTEKSAKKP